MDIARFGDPGQRLFLTSAVRVAICNKSANQLAQSLICRLVNSIEPRSFRTMGGLEDVEQFKLLFYHVRAFR